MGVLHIVDRVLVGCLLRQVQIKLQMGIALPHQERRSA